VGGRPRPFRRTHVFFGCGRLPAAPPPGLSGGSI